MNYCGVQHARVDRLTSEEIVSKYLMALCALPCLQRSSSPAAMRHGSNRFRLRFLPRAFPPLLSSMPLFNPWSVVMSKTVVPTPISKPRPGPECRRKTCHTNRLQSTGGVPSQHLHFLGEGRGDGLREAFFRDPNQSLSRRNNHATSQQTTHVLCSTIE
jgi:hypothetical protein